MEAAGRLLGNYWEALGREHFVSLLGRGLLGSSFAGKLLRFLGGKCEASGISSAAIGSCLGGLFHFENRDICVLLFDLFCCGFFATYLLIISACKVNKSQDSGRDWQCRLMHCLRPVRNIDGAPNRLSGLVVGHPS